MTARLAAALAALLAAGVASAQTPRTVAVFDFSLIDTSLQAEFEGVSPADLERLEGVTAYVREQLGRTDTFAVVDPGPTERDAHACNGCEIVRTRSEGAEFALVGWVQKVSNLILNLNIEMRDAASGRAVTGGSVDIRGNTDEGWYRAARQALRNTNLAPDAGLPPPRAQPAPPGAEPAN